MEKITVKQSLKHKIVAFLLAFVLMINASSGPIVALGNELVSAIAQNSGGAENLSGMPPDSGLADITIPIVSQNPYEMGEGGVVLPIFNAHTYDLIGRYSTSALYGYGINSVETDERSRFYTHSALVVGNWKDSSLVKKGVLTSELPYTENRINMLHSDLTLKSTDKGYGRITSTFDINNGLLKHIVGEGKNIWNYLDPSQTSMSVSSRVVSGRGSMYVNVYNINEYNIHASLRDESNKAERLEVNFPINEETSFISLDYNISNGVLTDICGVLLDNTAPYVKSIDFDMIKNLRDDEADLVMTIKLNEGIRYLPAEDIESLRANAYIDVDLYNQSAGETQTLRMFLENVDGTNEITFRGNIGRLHYCNFYVSGIKRVNIPTEKAKYKAAGALDLADEMLLGSGTVKKYGNAVRTVAIDNSYLKNGYFYYNDISLLSDHAGNGLNLSSLTGWSKQSLKNFRFAPDSFEATDVRVYNDKTLGVDLGEIGTEAITDSDMFVGPGSDLSVYVWLSRELSEELCKQVYITLNILDGKGKELKAYPTSATKYVSNEIYGDGSFTGTLLKFENISMTEEMSLSAPEGGTPQIWVTGMGTDYDPEKTGDPKAYPYVKAPSNIMYGDFTPPTAEIEKKELTPTIVGNYERITVEIKLADVKNYTNVSGLVGSNVCVSLSGGTEQTANIKYLLDTNATPPQDESGYTEIGTLSPNSQLAVGTYVLTNEETRLYLHILVERGEIYLNGLSVGVILLDMARNELNSMPHTEIDYTIDVIAPELSVITKRGIVQNGNASILWQADIKATDHSRIDRLLYFFGSEAPAESDWQVAQIGEFGNVIYETIEKEYEGNSIVQEKLWIKTIDTYGNESKVVTEEIYLDLSKPETVVKYDGNPFVVSNAHKILVSGPKASQGGTSAYTRVTLTPEGQEGYSYVTVIGTGETDVDVLALSGLTWYRVKTEENKYTEVSGGVTVENHNGLLDGLVGHYGELSVSFENGYGNMLPAVGELSAAASQGSYFADPNYYKVRYASPLIAGTDKIIHHVDFGNIIEYAVPFGEAGVSGIYNGAVVVADADIGAEPYLFNQKYKGINPMRNAQIHFSIANIANSSFGLLDLDYASSKVELVKVGEEKAVVTREGLWGAGSQYFTVPNRTDDGSYFTSGAYYLRVTVVSVSGQSDIYESSRVVLDAQTAENAGMWSYTYETVGDIRKPDTEDRYVAITKDASDSAFSDIGITVVDGGEISRDRFFATYSYGAESLKVVLSVPNSEQTHEGVLIGEVEGFKMWNVLSNPTKEEIEARPFALTPESDSYGAALTDTLVRTSNLTAIYTAETIPQGIAGFSKLYLVRGTNTFCYQVKMKNGYVSPIRQFTVTVSDEAPALSVSIDSYQPSITPSQISGVVNADHIRYYVDTAYSLNGSGNVNVELWSKYAMNIGKFEGDKLIDRMTEDPRGVFQKVAELNVEEYADFTENSYTAKFPHTSITRCTAVFIATDDYGGVTMVAPQIGDMDRFDVNAGVVGNAHEIDITYAGEYFDDPFDLSNNPYQYRIYYNQPVYFGAEILELRTYMIENTEDGEVEIKELQTFDESLRYNQFNISTNDINLSDGNVTEKNIDGYSYVSFDDISNINYVLLSGAKVTLWGGHIGETPVTVDFLTGDILATDENGMVTRTPNTIGYMYGELAENSLGEKYLRFYLANPEGQEGQSEINYSFEYGNIYGDIYTKTGNVALQYGTYSIKGIEMGESGAKLMFNFPVKDNMNANFERTGKFQSGNYTVTVPDYFGKQVTIEYTVAQSYDQNVEITYNKFTNTAEYVTITLKSDYNITVDITDYEIMSVEGNNTGDVTVTVKKNTEFSYRYIGANGEETMYITVDNIFEPAPEVVFDKLLGDDYANFDENGNKYLYGSVTVYLTDPEFILIDKFTGEIPSFTFTPGGKQYYIFEKENIVAKLGDETVELKEDIKVLLDVVLYEVPELEFSVDNDTETPNVQVLSYAKLQQAYSEKRLALALIAQRNSKAPMEHDGYETFRYVGNRANMSEILKRIGWSTEYRFEIETVDSSRIRLFVKEGLYAEAPDYATGKSDKIDGVVLNSKLLTVTKNAQFTLFVVDKFDNVSSIAFDISNLGEIPAPSVVKVPDPDDKTVVRVYLLAPVEVPEENFAINATLTQQTPKTDMDPESPYYGREYIEIVTNDDHPIYYTMTYENQQFDGFADVSVYEIDVDEIVLKEINWSDNKVFEATAGDVTADIIFTKDISDITMTSLFDSDTVSFITAGNTLRVTYTANHPAISFKVYAGNGTYTEVVLDAVNNIDRSAPKITLVSDELAADGKSLTLVLAANERTSFKEGNGRWGDETVVDGVTYFYYYITITENKKYTFTFADMSGIRTVFEYTANKLVLSPLSAQYNTAPSDESAVDDPGKLDLGVGDTVYIKLNRSVNAEISQKAELLSIAAGEWFSLVIPEGAAGIPPYIVYTDEYGNSLVHQFAKMEFPDVNPPEIIVNKPTYPVAEGTELEAIKLQLIGNFTVFDDGEGEIQKSVEIIGDVGAMGLLDVKYIAVDSAGNKTEVYGKLRITSVYEPVITIGETRILRDEGINLKSGENITLNIDTKGIAYKVIIASGKRTAAQLKTLEPLYAYNTGKTAELGVLENGFYTVLIVTEQREYFRILLAVTDL